MKILSAAGVVVVAVAASACGSGHTSTAPTTTVKKVSATAYVPALAKLPPWIRKHVENDLRALETRNSTVNTIEVYGPHSLTALDAATGGGSETQTPQERKARYYLTVLRGHFICVMCLGIWRSPPRGTVETFVWSPTTRDGGGFGLMHKLPRAVSRLHRLIRIGLR